MVCQQDFSATHLSASILKQHWLHYVWLGLPSRKSDEIRENEIRVSGFGLWFWPGPASHLRMVSPVHGRSTPRNQQFKGLGTKAGICQAGIWFASKIFLPRIFLPPF